MMNVSLPRFGRDLTHVTAIQVYLYNRNPERWADRRSVRLAGEGGGPTCDPCQPIDGNYQLTRQAIIILHSNGFNVTILTKGGNQAELDFFAYLR